MSKAIVFCVQCKKERLEKDCIKDNRLGYLCYECIKKNTISDQIKILDFL